MERNAAIETKLPLAWKPSFIRLQLVGWSIYTVLHFLSALSNGEPLAIFWSAAANGVTGLVLTSAMRPLVDRFWRHPAVQAAPMALALALLFAIPFSAVSEQVYWWVQGEGWKLHLDEPERYLGNAFWCGSILLVWAAVYLSIEFYHQAQEQRAAALRARAAEQEARLSALRNQINPHFLFNTLNGLSTLIAERECDAAEDMVERLADLLRASLSPSVSDLHSLDEELHLAELYIGIERARFAERLRFDAHIEPEARPALVPRLFLQPLLENAVRYAVSPSRTGAAIVLRAQIRGSILEVSVSDDGTPSANGSQGHGIGLKNVRERLHALFGDEGTLELESAAAGWTARMRLPLRRKSR